MSSLPDGVGAGFEVGDELFEGGEGVLGDVVAAEEAHHLAGARLAARLFEEGAAEGEDDGRGELLAGVASEDLITKRLDPIIRERDCHDPAALAEWDEIIHSCDDPNENAPASAQTPTDSLIAPDTRADPVCTYGE